MFSKVLVATDLSPASDKVIDYAKNLHSIGCSKIVLVHVIYVKHTVGLAEAMKEEAAPRLAQQKEALEAKGFDVSVEMPVGVPGPTITGLALEQGCKLILIGSHGYSMARELALGGVATDIVHRTETPLLVAKFEVFGEECEPCCRIREADLLCHVLYATDFSDNAERAFQYVEELARSGCKKVTLVHVQDISRIYPHLEHKLEEFNSIDRGRMERMKDRLMALGVTDVTIEIPYGRPAKEIVDYTRRECPSVVVMGTHGRGFISDILVGSVAHNVVRSSEAPVLLIPPVH